MRTLYVKSLPVIVLFLAFVSIQSLKAQSSSDLEGIEWKSKDEITSILTGLTAEKWPEQASVSVLDGNYENRKSEFYTTFYKNTLEKYKATKDISSSILESYTLAIQKLPTPMEKEDEFVSAFERLVYLLRQ